MIRFKVSEFDKIDKVLYFLANEGCEIIDTREFSITQPKEIIAKNINLDVQSNTYYGGYM